MNGPVLEQAAFDIDSLIAEVNPAPPHPPYTGRAPLHFTVTAFTPAEYLEATKYLHATGQGFGLHVGPPHTWHKGFSSSTATPGHAFTVFEADLGCADYDGDSHRFTVGRYVCSCFGGRVYRGHCECGWVSEITAAGRPPIEAWHDHAWPGWRDLPVVPLDVRPRGGGITKDNSMEKKAAQKAIAWVVEHYPPDFQKSGAPVVTERDGHGTGHVPGYSPWGGYDLAAERLGIDVERAA